MLGGIIHQEDHSALRDIGVGGIFGPGSRTEDIIDYIQGATGKRL
jgi:methylmalonyl-CoA mutase cobalamin-binding domain/chain